jgi:nicotinamidase-related amidase
MSQNNGRTKRSEKGLLTQDNCVVAFIDDQPQMLFGGSNFDRQTIINNAVALAKATRVFDLPVVLTSIESKSYPPGTEVSAFMFQRVAGPGMCLGEPVKSN